MSSNTTEPTVVRVSQKGQATIPKALREKFGIEAPGEVFIYEEGDRIVVEPVPSLAELHGIHGGEHEPGAVMERVRRLQKQDAEQEDDEAARLLESHRPDEDA